MWGGAPRSAATAGGASRRRSRSTASTAPSSARNKERNHGTHGKKTTILCFFFPCVPCFLSVASAVRLERRRPRVVVHLVGHVEVDQALVLVRDRLRLRDRQPTRRPLQPRRVLAQPQVLFLGELDGGEPRQTHVAPPSVP